jgi:prophage regulatory protein
MAESPIRILRRRDVERATGLRRSALYDAISKGTFPRPVQLTEKAVGWPEPEVDEWIASRIRARDASSK